MSDDPTKDLTDSEKLDRILQRLSALEAQGSGSTRPLLDQILKEMIQTRDTLTVRVDVVDARLERIEVQLKILTQDVMQVRTDQHRIENRLDLIERKPN